MHLVRIRFDAAGLKIAPIVTFTFYMLLWKRKPIEENIIAVEKFFVSLPVVCHQWKWKYFVLEHIVNGFENGSILNRVSMVHI